MSKDQTSIDENGILRYRLKNGSTILIKEDPSSSVVSLNLWIEAGSIDERPDERGMAHLIEHMIFKGTDKRGVGEISREVEAAGGYLNAFTSFEHTCFYVVLPSSQIQKALEVEFDAYLHSTFDAKELEKEKEVVFEEMRMRHDDPWSWSWELLFGTLYKQNPYHWPVIGDMSILKNIPKEKLLKYYKTHYAPLNTVVTVVGNVSSKKIISWIKKNFEQFTAPKTPPREFKYDSEPKSLSLHTEAGDVQQIYLSLGYPTVPLMHLDAPALEMLDSILGDGVASRLNLNIREKSQSADEIGTELFSGKYGGSFVFQALTDLNRIEKCLTEMMSELKKIILNGVDEAELRKVKNKILASKVYEKQSVDGQAKTLGFWELQGDYQMERKFLKTLDSVSSKDIQNVAEKYLKPHRASLVIYHPKSQKVKTTSAFWQSVIQKGFDAESTKVTNETIKKEKIKKIKLKNGSVLWIKERKGLPIISLGVFFKGGFVEERAEQYGITSLMAKCLLKGTRFKTNEELSKEIEGLAAHLDTQMEKDYWGLTLDTLTGNFDKSFNLFLETLLGPSFLEFEVKKEKKLQIASIERLKDDPTELALLQSDVLTFSGTPYAHMPLGNVKSISKVSAHDLQTWHQKHISPSNMTWIAVGDFKSVDLKKMIDGKMLPTYSKKYKKRFNFNSVSRQRTFRLKTEGQQANLVLGFKAPVFGSKEYFVFRVLTTILNGMGGRLFVELREKKSLAYSVFASHDAGAMAGIYQVYIGCAPQKVEQAKIEVLKVLNSFSKTKISIEELERAKTYMIGLYQMGQQSNRSQLLSYARHEVLGKGAPWIEKFPDLIKKVTSAEIQKVAKKYLEINNKTWVLLTPD